MTFTSRRPPRSSTAYTLPATRLLTKSVPLSPHTMARALLMPLAHSETLKPRGTLILSTGISLAAAGPGGWAIGARVELARSAGWPCFHGGGAWATAGEAGASASITTREMWVTGRIVVASSKDMRAHRGPVRGNIRRALAGCQGGHQVTENVNRPAPGVAQVRGVASPRARRAEPPGWHRPCGIARRCCTTRS